MFSSELNKERNSLWLSSLGIYRFGHLHCIAIGSEKLEMGEYMYVWLEKFIPML